MISSNSSLKAASVVRGSGLIGVSNLASELMRKRVDLGEYNNTFSDEGQNHCWFIASEIFSWLVGGATNPKPLGENCLLRGTGVKESVVGVIKQLSPSRCPSSMVFIKVGWLELERGNGGRESMVLVTRQLASPTWRPSSMLITTAATPAVCKAKGRRHDGSLSFVVSFSQAILNWKWWQLELDSAAFWACTKPHWLCRRCTEKKIVLSWWRLDVECWS